MLLLGAGESGKVGHFHTRISYHNPYQPIVDGTETNEANPPRRLQRDGTRFLQGNHIFKYNSIHAVRKLAHTQLFTTQAHPCFPTVQSSKPFLI